MPFEMSCANCNGRLMVDTLGIVVACPHCQTHLAIPTELPGIDSAPQPPDVPAPKPEHESAFDVIQGNKSTVEEEGQPWFPGPHLDDSPSSFPDFSALGSKPQAFASSDSNVLISEPEHGPTESRESPEVPSAVAIEVTEEEAEAAVAAIPTGLSGPISSFPLLVESPPANSPAPTPTPTATASEPPAPAAEAITAPPTAAEKKPASPAGEPAYQSARSRRGKVIPPAIFQAWLSYTILMTGGLVLAVYYIVNAPASNLESLPDIKPQEDKLGKVVRKLVPEKASMPPGHVLVLGQTRRFGNLEVTPLKVTHGPLEFVHYADQSRRKPPDGPALKLWIRFKNVSADQSIDPLGAEILFFRDIREDRKAGAWANNFVCPADDKHKNGELVLLYDHLVAGEWDLKGQNVDQALAPGEETIIYVPTETERLDKLTGELIWRVHFRKGYSPQNYGVTTLFEVEFHRDAVEPEAA